MIREKIESFFNKFYNTTDSAIFILKDIAFQERKKLKGSLTIEQQVFFIFTNRMLIDGRSAALLSKKGYYGSASSLVAVMMRSETMYASLVSDKTRLDAFWNEEKDTYYDDADFYKNFKESTTRKVAQKEFGEDAFQKADLEKLLHGSCYAIRRSYSQRKIDENGKSYPFLTMGNFFEEDKRFTTDLLIRGVLLDFLGVFFTGYYKKEKYGYEKEYGYYKHLIKLTTLDTRKKEKQLTDQGR